MKSYLVDRSIRNQSNYPFWFSMLQETNKIIDFDQINTVVDFGCGSGGFVQLISQMFDNIYIYGIEKDYTLLLDCQKNNNFNNIAYLHYDKLSELSNVDLIFSQEVVYTQESLSHHANEIFNALREGGHYVFTMGCHIENPTWSRRRRRINNEEKYCAFDYSIEDVANAFFDAGFRVTVKKLAVDIPIKYVPSQNGEFHSLLDMISSSEEHKYLFVMLKPYIKKVDYND